MKLTGFSIADILSEERDHDRRDPWSYSPRQICEYAYGQPLYIDLHQSLSPLSETSPSSSPSPSFDVDDDKITRRPRTSITICQRDFLEREFQDERYPTLAYIDKLSRRIGLPQYVIKVWYQNRRAKYRKENHRRKRTVEETSSADKLVTIENDATSSSTEKKSLMIDLTSSRRVHPYCTKDKKRQKFTHASAKCCATSCKCVSAWTSPHTVPLLSTLHLPWANVPRNNAPTDTFVHGHTVNRTCVCSECPKATAHVRY